MLNRQLVFWFISYTVLITGISISIAGTAVNKKHKFRIFLATNISLVVIVISVSLILLSYNETFSPSFNLYYIFLESIFYIGIISTGIFISKLPSAVFPDGKPVSRLFILVVYTAEFSGLLITSILAKWIRPGNEIISIINGIFQLATVVSLLGFSIAALTEMLNRWQGQSFPKKAVIMTAGILFILSVFSIDFIYGLWSKLHFDKEISIFYMLPVYAVSISVLLSMYMLRCMKSKPLSAEAVKTEQLSRYGISSREEDVVKLLIAGKSYKEIAGSLFISLPTVQTHIRNIYRKTGVNSKIGLLNLLRENNNPG